MLKQCHSAEKLERGDPSGFLKFQFAAKYQKIEGGTLWRQKNSKKIRTVPKKYKWGDPVVPPGFVSYVKN